MSRRWTLPVAALFLLAACGPGGIPALPSAPARTATPAPPGTSAVPTAAAEVDMCALMSLGDVQGMSPFSTPLAEAIEGGAPGMCQYKSAVGADEPVSILLVVTDFGTAANALAHQNVYRQQAIDQGFAIAEVGGVGDDAFSFGSDMVGVHAARGQLAVDANLGGEYPDTSDASKASAATNLVKAIFARLP